jgi:hypothetical protein
MPDDDLAAELHALLTTPLEELETFDQKRRRANYHVRQCYDGTVTPNHDLTWHHHLTEDTPWLPMDFVPDVAADRWCAGSWRRVCGHRIVIRQYIRDGELRGWYVMVDDAVAPGQLHPTEMTARWAAETYVETLLEVPNDDN